MKRVIVAGVFLMGLATVSACSHIRVVAFDNEANTVTIEAGRFDNPEKARAEAERYCRGPVELVAMKEKTVGTQTFGQASSYGYGIYGSSFSQDVNHQFFKFRCVR